MTPTFAACLGRVIGLERSIEAEWLAMQDSLAKIADERERASHADALERLWQTLDTSGAADACMHMIKDGI